MHAAPDNLQISEICPSRGPHVLRTKRSGSVPARRRVARQDPARNQTRRYPGRATDDVQARRQPQDRQGAWLEIPESFLLRGDTVAGTKCEFHLVRVTTAHE